MQSKNKKTSIEQQKLNTLNLHPSFISKKNIKNLYRKKLLTENVIIYSVSN